MVPAAVCATLSSKWELTTCNTFSVLSGELFTASQCSTRAHAERTMATWYHMLCSGHWLPPPTGASGSPTCWVSCRLTQLSHCISLFTLFTEPRVDKALLEKPEENLRCHRTCRQVYSLQTRAAAIRADMLYFLILDPADTALTALM